VSEDRDEKPRIVLEDVAPIVLELAAQPALPALVARFLELVRTWAAPSAVVAAARDPRSDSGWRLLPAVSVGSVPLGIERSLAGIVQDTPECLTRPTVLRPREDVPGVKPRDNWIVPWSFEGESGLLLLRGVPRPYPANLGEALALVSAPLWPRLLGGPAARVEALVEELRGLSLRLQDETSRQLERLQAASAGETTPPQGGTDDGRLATLEQELQSARETAERATRASQQLSERLRGVDAAERSLRAERDEARAQAQQLEPQAQQLQSQLAALESQRDEARAQAQQLEPQVQQLQEQLAALGSQRDEARAQAQQLEPQAQQLESQVHQLQEQAQQHQSRAEALESQLAEERSVAQQLSPRLSALAAERDALQAELQQLASHGESLDSKRGSVDARIEEQRRVLEAAEQRARAGEETLVAAQRELAAMRALGEPKELRERLARIETALETTTTERDRARSETDRLAAQIEPLQSERTADKGRFEELRRACDAAETKARTAEEALAGVQAQLSNARALREKAETRSRELAESWERTLDALRVGLAAVRRAAFVPPGLRLSMEDAAAHMGPAAERPAPWLHIALLDRDPVSLDALTEELEAAGLDVRIANYPEELGLLLRTPGARDLAAVVCDVMAFRPDQNVAGLFRSWDKDRPGLAYFLAYNSDNSGELDRARRIPQSLTIAHLPRPLAKARLVETMEMLAKRRAQS
jgi:uncharacterized coiled-coil DUF342 family protein